MPQSVFTHISKTQLSIGTRHNYANDRVLIHAYVTNRTGVIYRTREIKCELRMEAIMATNRELKTIALEWIQRKYPQIDTEKVVQY